MILLICSLTWEAEPVPHCDDNYNKKKANNTRDNKPAIQKSNNRNQFHAFEQRNTSAAEIDQLEKTASMLKQRRGNKTNLPYSSIRTGPVQALTPQGGEIALDYALLST